MLTYDEQGKHFQVDGNPVELSPQEIEVMNSYEWRHAIPFAPGVAPQAFCDNPTDYIQHYMLDKIDFKGKSVLDIGCWDGFQLFYAESQGASKVVGVDKLDQRHMNGGAREFAARKLESTVEFHDINVYDLNPDVIGTFDIVMMFGVLYHLVHPMLGIEKACGVCKSELLLASHVLLDDDELPFCMLYPNDELERDHSNWTGPSKTWVLQALAINGFVTSKGNTYTTDRATFYAQRRPTHHIANKMLNSHRDTSLMK